MNRNGLSEKCLFEIDKMWIEYYNELKSGNEPNFEGYKQQRQEIVEKYSPVAQSG